MVHTLELQELSGFAMTTAPSLKISIHMGLSDYFFLRTVHIHHSFMVWVKIGPVGSGPSASGSILTRARLDSGSFGLGPI
jgi:hypothetical protein